MDRRREEGGRRGRQRRIGRRRGGNYEGEEKIMEGGRGQREEEGVEGKE